MIPLKIRKQVFERDQGKCIDCGGYGDWRHWVEYSHTKHRKMGGNPKMDTVENIKLRCPYHRDIFDGRIRNA